MHKNNFNTIKVWYADYLKKQAIIKNKEIDIKLKIDQTFYLFENNIMSDFFEQLDSLNFETIVINKIGTINKKEEIVSNIIEFRNTFKRYFHSYQKWKLNDYIINPIKKETINKILAKDIIVATYIAAKKYYEKQINTTNKMDYYDIIQNYSDESYKSFKQGSANIYLAIFINLMDGKAFSGNASDEYTRYFIENIYLDYGLEKLNNALCSLALNIEKSIQHKISLGNDIAEKYKTLFPIKNDALKE